MVKVEYIFVREQLQILNIYSIVKSSCIVKMIKKEMDCNGCNFSLNLDIYHIVFGMFIMCTNLLGLFGNRTAC
jgi:hypothetical protein